MQCPVTPVLLLDSFHAIAGVQANDQDCRSLVRCEGERNGLHRRPIRMTQTSKVPPEVFLAYGGYEAAAGVLPPLKV